MQLKEVASLAIIGGLGGGICGIYAYNNTTDTVKNYLIKNNLTVIEKTNSAFWAKVLETYKLEKTEELSISSSDTVTSDNIIDWCDNNLNTEINSTDNDLFKKASKWCVNYETIEEKWTSDRFEGEVAKLANKYSTLTDPIKGQVDKETFTSGSNSNGDKIKRWCDTNKKRRFSTDDNIYSNNIKTICLKTV